MTAVVGLKPLAAVIFFSGEEGGERVWRTGPEIWFLAGIKLDRSVGVPSITRTLLD